MNKQKLLKMQLTATLAIWEQVLEKVDKKLCKLAEESTSNIPSATTSKSNKRKPGLAQLISKSSKETKLRSEAADETLFETEEGEEAGLIIQGLINFWQNFKSRSA